MRIVHYYPRALTGDGGATLAVRGWARALSVAGHGVRVISAPGPPQALDGVEWHPIAHIGRGRLFVPSRLEPLLRGADLLFLHSAWVLHNIVAARAAKHIGIPYVVTPHGGYDPHILRRNAVFKRVWWRMLERRLLRDAAAVHLFFASEVRHLAALGHSGPAVVAPNGVEVPMTERWVGRSGDYVLWLGRFDVDHKGLDLLLEAVAAIPEHRRPHLRLHGPDSRGGKAQTRNLVSALGLDRWVMIGPAIYGAAKWNALRNARLFVYPSRWDAHSVAIAEAAAMGLPVLTTTGTFLGPELARLGAAIAVPPVSHALSEGLLRGLAPEAASLGDAARRVCKERYAWDLVASRLIEQLAELRVTPE